MDKGSAEAMLGKDDVRSQEYMNFNGLQNPSLNGTSVTLEYSSMRSENHTATPLF
jgi:hypothetical protein